MKKILLILIALGVMQTIATAQVDYSVLEKDQIWLFDYPYSQDLTADGFILGKGGGICEYEDANYPQMRILETIKEYRRNKAVINPCSFYFGSINFDKEGKKVTFTRSEFEWHIITLTNDAFVLKKGKRIVFDYEFSNDLPTYLKFKRNKKYTSGCLPILLLGGGSMDGDMIEAGICNYFDVLPFNSPVCINYYNHFGDLNVIISN
jgi:uncharacterized protein YxeA